MEQRPEHAAGTMPIVPLIVFFGMVAALLVVLLGSQPASRQAQTTAGVPTTAAEATAEATIEVTVEATAQAADVTWNLEPQAVAAGETVFHSICMACHGFNGEGIQGLGKTLIGSDFVNGLTDDELAAFIIKGRDVSDPLNTTGIMMPPRGGNPALSDQDVAHTVAFVRSMNVAAGFGPVAGGAAAGAAAAQPTAAAATPTLQVAVVPTVVNGITPEIGQGELNLTAMDGEQAYLWACASCHGTDGSPVAPYATQPLSASQLMQAHADDSLLAFLAQPLPPVSPVEAFPHPYRGGYPALTDEQLREVITYLYTLPAAN